MDNLESTSILIVEDEKIVAWDIQEKLEKLGYNVVASVSSGVDAVEAASRYKPDLALMDIKINGQIDGIETAQLLYNSWNIPIIYLTAHSDEETLAKATQTNPLGYLLKPFQSRELHTTIQIALQRHHRETLASTMQQWLASTLNNLGEATITTDRDGNVTFMNEMAEEMTGWQQDDAIGNSVNRVLPLFCGETRTLFRNPGMQAMHFNRRVTLDNDCWLRNVSGKEIPVQNVATPILNETGQIVGSAIVLHDNTEQHWAQMELWHRSHNLEQFQMRLITKLARQTTQLTQLNACVKILVQLLNSPRLCDSGESSLDWALQQLGDALDLDYAWLALYHEEQDLAVLTHEYHNPHNLDSLEPKSLVGVQIQMKEFRDFYDCLLFGDQWSFPPDSILPEAYQFLQDSTNRLRIYPIRVKEALPRGSRMVTIGEIGILSSNYLAWSDIQVTLLTEIIGYATNVSLYADLAAARQTNKIDLEILNYLKEDFISSVSHALKTPLTNMKMAIKMLKYLINSPSLVDLEPKITSEIAELDRQQLALYLEILEKEWESESKFVGDLLNFQAPVTLIPASDLMEISFSDWLPAIGDRFLPQTRSLKQTLTYQIHPQDLTFISHPQILEQILTELLNNACKHTGKNQSIIVSIRAKGEKVEIIVSNTGIIIPKSELESIFQPFYRITHGNPWDCNGTGLGLALVKRLVARLGGEIHAESGDGVTRFAILI